MSCILRLHVRNKKQRGDDQQLTVCRSLGEFLHLSNIEHTRFVQSSLPLTYRDLWRECALTVTQCCKSHTGS